MGTKADGTEGTNSSGLRSVPHQFLVAFSFAGEQRQLIQSIAKAVEERIGHGTVFYDDWFEHYIAGDDADVRLQKIYGERAVLVVPCISANYGGKPWTKAEHRAIRALQMRIDESSDEGDQFRVLPLRVGDGEVDGVLFNTIVPDIRNRTLESIVNLILQRLKLVRPDLAIEFPDTVAEHTTAAKFSVKAKGTTDKLRSDIRRKIETLSDACQQRIHDRFDQDFGNQEKTVSSFVDWLVDECPATRAVARLNGIARESNTSTSDETTLGQLGSRLIPLRYAPDVVKRIRQQLESDSFEIVRGNIGNSSIAEVIMAGFDVMPFSFETGDKIGVTAFEFLECGDYGPGQTDTAVKAFAKDILNAWDDRFGDNFLDSSGGTLEDLVRRLKARVNVMEDEHDRTVYCLAKLPSEDSKRRELESVLQRAATLVPNLVFLEVDGRFNEEDFEFLTCITRMPKS
jgi:hypothetical protein